jgi:CTP synthase
MGEFICQRLGWKCEAADFSDWQKVVEAIVKPEHEVKIALIGKYAGLSDSYVSMSEALRHGGAACRTRVSTSYLEAERLEQSPDAIEDLKDFDGVFVPYGFGPRGTEGKIAAIRFARENNIPFLGICYGFQLSVIEFARDVCGLKDANSSEINPTTPHPVIDLMPEQRGVEIKGATMRLGAHKGTRRGQPRQPAIQINRNLRAPPPPLRSQPRIPRYPHQTRVMLHGQERRRQAHGNP